MMNSKEKPFIAKTVDEYLASLPEPAKNALANLRAAIRQAAPEAEECISYQIPTYKYKGMLVHFAAFKNHCGFYGVSKTLIDEYKDRLPGCKISGTTIQLRPTTAYRLIWLKRLLLYVLNKTMIISSMAASNTAKKINILLKKLSC